MKNTFIYISIIFLTVMLNAKEEISPSTFKDIANNIINDEKYIEDKNIKIKVPSFADNSLQVPIFVDASKIKNTKRMVLFADYNPIPIIIDMDTKYILPVISTNIKVAQETPLRVLVKDDKNLWHVKTSIIKSAGGGCDVTSLASKNKDFMEKLGEVKGKVFNKKNVNRIKTSIFHPMETGLVFGSSEFYINKILIKENNKVISSIKTSSVISENPRFTFEINSDIKNLSIHFLDTGGNDFELKL